MKTHSAVQIETGSLPVALRPRTFAIAALTLLASPFLSAQDCKAPATWFPHTQTPAPNPAAFPGNATATDCDFHQWAWQEFLYVTQMVNGAPRFLSYPSDADLFPANAAQKPAKTGALKARATRPPLQLKVRNVKARVGGVVEDAGSIFQAGSDGILVAHDGNPLYYSVHLDWTFYDFVESHSYYDYNTYIKANPNTVFPIGATEFKASWKIIPTNSTFAGYTVAAQVPTLSTDSKGNIVAGAPLRNVTVGLVGLHVVGIVANHPEFVWETFEQVDNAPDVPPGIRNLPPTSTIVPVVSPKNYTFYTANTLLPACNVQASSLTLNATAQTLAPITQVARLWGAGDGVPDNVLSITTLNASVHAQMQKTDVFSNYKLIGGVWLLPGVLQPNLAPVTSQLHGSPNLSNATMETYVQPGFPPNTSCFICHTTTASSTNPTAAAPQGLPIPPMNMNLSHVLTDGLVTQELVRLKLLKK